MIDKEYETGTEYFLIETLIPILTFGRSLDDYNGDPISQVRDSVIIGDDTTQSSLNMLIQTISLRGQPIMLGQVIGYRDTLENLTINGLYGNNDDGDGSDTVYKIRFAIEHAKVWNLSLLLDALNSSNIFTSNTNDSSYDDIIVTISTSI